MPEIDYISRYADELVRAAAECRAPIVHAHSNYLNGLAAAWAARRAGGASVYEIRGLWHLTRAALEPAFAATRLYAYQAQMELQAMSQVDRVIVPSPVMREWLVGEGVDAGRISLVPYSANLATITPMAGNTELVKQLGLEGKFILGFVGSITGYEGLDTVLAAIDTCAKRGLDAVLVLVGDGPALPGLRRLARRLGIARRLVEIGRVPGQDVPKYYSIFDVCPVVRRDVAVCRLVSPLKPAEIMAAGKPMIVSALPSLLEYGEEGTSRVSVPPDDAGQLADCIMSLSRDRARLVLLGTEARQWAVRHLDDHDIGARYAAIYRELLDRPKPQMPTG
jgi:glycosyltransferase involved in cell wall biosynthesis